MGRMRVGLFLGCYNDMLFPEVGRAAVRVLDHLGIEAVFPEEQTCCGQLHFNSGYRDACMPLVRTFTRTFSAFETIVTPAASCAAMVRAHYPTLVAGVADPGLTAVVAELAPRVLELTEFLVELTGGAVPGASFPHVVAFHPTCHSLRLMEVGDRPRRLLAGVAGLRLAELPSAEQCCGFGGTFAVKNEATSIAMGTDKVAAIEASGAEVVTAVDTSCLMHIGGLLSRRGSPVRAMHLVEILAAGLPA